LRPIRPEDELQHAEFISALAPDDFRLRFQPKDRSTPHPQRSRSVVIDYDREMAFVAIAKDDTGTQQMLGVVRAFADPDNNRADFVIVVRSDMKRKGLGAVLMNKMIPYCRSRGTSMLVTQVTPENRPLMSFATQFGFKMHEDKVTKITEVRLAL